MLFVHYCYFCCRVDADVEDELSSSDGEDSDSSDSKVSNSNAVSCSGVSNDENTNESVKKVDECSKDEAAKSVDESNSCEVKDKNVVGDVNKSN